MKLAKNRNTQNVCLPNALMTFKEFLMNYTDDELREIGNKTIEANLSRISSEKILELTKERLKKIDNGERDFFL